VREILRVVLACSLFVASPALAAVDGAEESWFSIAFHGKKVGYVRARETRAKLAGRPAIHAERWSVITVRRREQQIRMEHELDAWFDPDGTPLRYAIVRREGGELRKGEGYKDGERFVVQHTVGGRTKTRSFPLRPGDRLASSLEWLHFRELDPGKKVEGRAIDETEGDIQPFTLAIADAPTKKGGDVYAVDEVLGGIRSALLVSRERGLLRSELLGAGIVMERTSREEAVRLDEAVDIFSAALFPVGVELPARDALEEVTTVFAAEGGEAPTVPAFERQTVRARETGRVEVSVEAPPVPAEAASLPIRSQKLAPFLAATDYEDLSDEQLITVARREVGDAEDAWTAARRLNAFVHRHLRDKTLAHAFASATEALEARAGDCTEHAVLFSALAKIVGIPTKLATGLVYVGGARPAFGYHEWVEVWLGDDWHPMDPTFGQDVADATHIKFSEGLSDPAGLRDAGLAAAALIGDIEVELESYVVDGERVRP
jgi:hypothetical protein